jgi:hypothetical protein
MLLVSKRLQARVVQGDKLNAQCKAVFLKQEEEIKLLFQKLKLNLLVQVVIYYQEQLQLFFEIQ